MTDKKLKSVINLFVWFQVTSKMAFMYCLFTGVLIHLHITVSRIIVCFYILWTSIQLLESSNKCLEIPCNLEACNYIKGWERYKHIILVQVLTRLDMFFLFFIYLLFLARDRNDWIWYRILNSGNSGWIIVMKHNWKINSYKIYTNRYINI